MKAMTAQDIDDPERINQIKWGHAISMWQEGYKLLLRPLLIDSTIQIPDFAREFLADLAEGNVIKDIGRPTDRPGWYERKIVTDAFHEWERSTKESACHEVAERYSLKYDAVRGILDRFAKSGITKEVWIRYGRPNW